MDCDYIVVGAGSSGCVLANRLTGSPKNRVLLLEAGPEDKNFWIHIPLGFGKNINNPEVNWCYEGQAEPYCRGQRYLLMRESTRRIKFDQRNGLRPGTSGRF